MSTSFYRVSTSAPIVPMSPASPFLVAVFGDAAPEVLALAGAELELVGAGLDTVTTAVAPPDVEEGWERVVGGVWDAVDVLVTTT